MLNSLRLVSLLTAVVILTACSTTMKNPPTTTARVDLQRYLGVGMKSPACQCHFRKPMKRLWRNMDRTRMEQCPFTISPFVQMAASMTSVGMPKFLIPSKYEAGRSLQYLVWAIHSRAERGELLGSLCGRALSAGDCRHPEPEVLWILSRTPKLPDPQFQELMVKAKEHGFDLSRLIRDPSH